MPFSVLSVVFYAPSSVAKKFNYHLVSVNTKSEGGQLPAVHAVAYNSPFLTLFKASYHYSARPMRNNLPYVCA